MNDNNAQNEIDDLNGVIIALWAGIFDIGLMLIAAYNEHLRKTNQQPFFDLETEKTIIIVSRIIIFLDILYFLYVAYKKYFIEETEVDNSEVLLQFVAGVFAIIAAGIYLYISITNKTDSNTIIENKN